MTDQPSAGNSHLRDTHPNLYRSLTTIGLIDIALAGNFLLTTPTFNPLGTSKYMIGVVFLALGLAYLLFLNAFRSIRAMRVLTMVSIFVMTSWGIGTTETFFSGKSSLQLCILYFGLSALQVPLLLEPFLNPVTSNGNGRKP